MNNPDFSIDKEIEEYDQFMSRVYSHIIFRAACLMQAIAPKTCECGCVLNVPELSFRFDLNIEPFLCYNCIKKYEKSGAMIIPSVEPGYPKELRIPTA